MSSPSEKQLREYSLFLDVRTTNRARVVPSVDSGMRLSVPSTNHLPYGTNRVVHDLTDPY